MFDSLQVCFNAIVPLFLLMGLGYGAKCLGAIRVEDVPWLNKLAFRYFMPVMLFWNLYTSSLDHAVQPRLLLYAVAATLVMYGLSLAIVLPTETDNLKVVDGKDYVTLMTCTPYGINTHRLLVRGRRVETPDQYKHLRVTAEALKIEPIIVAPIMALPMLLILLIGMLLSTRKPKKTRGEEHEKH